MRSHSVPKKLLEQFTFEDRMTKSRRLWTYEKGLPPYASSPRSATRWDGHFADPRNASKEEELERRLNHEIEEPVNEFIGLLRYSAFVLSLDHKRKLTRYITLLFNRSRGRMGATQHQLDQMLGAMQSMLSNDAQLQTYADKLTIDALAAGIPLERPITKKDVALQLKRTIQDHSAEDQLRHQYSQTIEDMLTFEDTSMMDGRWEVVRADPGSPLVIGDAPVVTWERTEPNTLMFGQGFSRPNVEVFLPVAPDACIHVLPSVIRTRAVQRPDVEEINMAEASFATKNCFTNVNHPDLDRVLQAHFYRTRLGVSGFTLNHRDFSNTMFEILMSQRGTQ